jgi:cobalt-zinc-cadmium efflux system protein
MEHHSHIHKTDGSLENISFAFILNLVFAVIEVIGGLLTNSVAIMSDALHDIGDSISLGMAWFLQKKSRKKSDEFYSYGYRRFSLLGAIFISIVLIVSSVFILRECVIRLSNPQVANAKGMLIFAIVGVVVNGFAAYRLKKGHSLNERAVSLHLLEDVLGWLAVLVVSIVMLFINVPILDPLLSIGITIWVLTNVYKNLRDTFKVLLQEVPQNIDVNRMLNEISRLPHIESLHDFHLWSLDGERNIMTMHVVTKGTLPKDGQLLLKQQIRDLASSFKIEHVTLEFETTNESDDCEFREGCE